jgi:16S rRNA processing protein RimM
MPFQDRDQPHPASVQKRVCLGKIVSPHGVKGLVKILPYGDDPALLETAPVYTSENGHETIKISLKNAMGKFILAAIFGVNDRNEAEALEKCSLYVPRETLPEITDNNTYYYEDLIGLQALDTQGEVVGKVVAVDNFGAGELLEIKPLSGSLYYIPFTNDYVPDVNLENRTVTIIPLVMDQD